MPSAQGLCLQTLNIENLLKGQLESYKQQQMATYEASTDEIFCERDKAVCIFGGNKTPGAQIPASELSQSQCLVSDLLLAHI